MAKRFAMVAAASGVTLAFAALILAVGEIAIPSVHLLRDGTPFFESAAGGRVGPITLDQELGWRATEHYEEALVEKTKGGALPRSAISNTIQILSIWRSGFEQT